MLSSAQFDRAECDVAARLHLRQWPGASRPAGRPLRQGCENLRAVENGNRQYNRETDGKVDAGAGNASAAIRGDVPQMQPRQDDMTAVPIMTPARDLFRELAELGNLLYCMLAGPQTKVRRWPAYYLVYVQIDRLCHEVSQTTGYLSRGFEGAGGAADHAAIAAINACLTRLDAHVRTIADLLAGMEGCRQLDYGAPELKRIVSHHFSPGSRWHLAIREHYCSGRVSADGRFLHRVCVPLDPLPGSASARDRQDTLVEAQEFALGSAQSRMLLTRTAREIQTRLNQVYAAVGAFFVAHCASVGELLHPSTK